MKKLLTITFLTFTMSSQLFSTERVLISDNKIADVTLNNTSVRCSTLGYGLQELKINIPALDGWTLFDHSNINLGDFPGEPCMTAGACKRNASAGGFSIEDILGDRDSVRVERIKINRQIVEVKELSKNEEGADICLRHIEERLRTSIRRGDGLGVMNFNHQRIGMEETFPVQACH